MQSGIVLALLAACHLCSASPLQKRHVRADGDGVVSMDVNIFEDALLLDSAAYETEGASTKTANFRVYQFVRQPEGELTNVIFGKVIPDLLRLVPGLEIVGDGLETLVSRIRLFVSIPRGDSKITVHVPSCKGNNGIVLGKTHKTTGFLESNVNLGDCAFGDDNSVGGEIRALELPLVGHFGVEDVENTIYFSPPGGWGVVSDIDDTIKDSAVGDVLQTISKTFLEPFEPVTNMPELFSSLSTSLSTSDAPAQFFYLSSSPVQLYPHLHPFIQAKFPAGPLILRNYTFTDIPTLIDNLLLPTRDYKLGELRKIHSWYPDKKQLLVGDSTQEDPEAYGAAFREFGADWVGCIWIRAVDGSDNSDARFEAAFDGVPREKWRVFTDPVADELSNVDVVGGSC